MKKLIAIALITLGAVSLSSFADPVIPITPNINAFLGSPDSCGNEASQFSGEISTYARQLPYSQAKPYYTYRNFFSNFAVDHNDWNESCSGNSCQATTSMDCWSMLSNKYPYGASTAIHSAIKNYLQIYLNYYAASQINPLPNQYFQIVCSYDRTNPSGTISCQPGS